MAIRNNLLGGTDYVKEHPSLQSLNDTNNAIIGKEYADNTGGNTSTTETDLATITISQNDLNDNATLIINAGFSFIHTATGNASDATGTFKLYIGGVAVKTITKNTTNSLDGGKQESGGVFTYLATGVDTTTGDVIVKVTGAVTGSGTKVANCTGLIVRGYNR